MANEQYKELTRLIKRGEEDTFKALQLQQPSVRDKLIPLHQNNLFTGLAARVKELTDDVQRVLQDAGDYTKPPEMNDAEFHEVLAQIANSILAARRSGHTRREALAIPNIGNASQQSIDPVAGMSAMSSSDVIRGPMEGQMRTMLDYAVEAKSEPGTETWNLTTDKSPPVLQYVDIYQPVVVTPSERRLRRMRSHRAVIVDEKEILDEDNADRTEK